MTKSAPVHLNHILSGGVDDPRLFSSFGPRPSMETIGAMRAHPGSTEAMGKLIALWEAAELGTNLVEATTGEASQVT